MKRVILLICLLILCSCGNKWSDKIEGKWRIDHKGARELLKKQKMNKNQINFFMKKVSKREFEFSNDTIKEYIKPPTVYSEASYTVDVEKGNTLKIKDKAGKVYSFKFIDDDTFDTKIEGKTIRFKRKK